MHCNRAQKVQPLIKPNNMEFSYTFKISGESKENADQIAKALHVVYTNIKNEDLIWVSEKIKEDPKVINKVVKIANNPLVKRLW